MEVLAPAGGWEALEAAVFSGADAVYLGGPAFGARANAKNFTREELEKAVAFCHGRGVRVHVTVNTVLKDKELPEALEFVSFLCSLPVDAVLVQDMGLFALLRRLAPELPIHASTQMSLHTPEGVKLMNRLGAQRAVLARELSLEEIKEISKACPIELEAFIHGALCMSVSGQCYFSAMLGGRSGNRGMCAQPCRLPFAAPGGTGHDLSLKDLSFITEMEKLSAAGVCSAKIEGRMKRPEYVAAAAAACRKAADGQPVPRELCENLEAVFSRSGFTKGYLTGRRGADMFGVRTKEDVTGATGKVFASLRGLYRGENQRVAVSFTLSEEEGRIKLAVMDKDGREAFAYAQAPEGEIAPLTRERCEQQLKKTGGTPFFAENVNVPEEGALLGVSQLNALRREALTQLLSLREKGEKIPFSGEKVGFPPRISKVKNGRLPIRACFRDISQICPEAKECESIALPLDTDTDDLNRLREEGYPPVLLELPRVMFGREEKVARKMREKIAEGYSHFICGNLGSLALCIREKAHPHAGFSLNVTNTHAAELFRELGCETVEASFELTGKELEALGGSAPLGVMMYGRQALMAVRNCPLANGKKGCLNCKVPGHLTDRMQKKFPVVCSRPGSGEDAEVLNSVPLWLGDREKDMKNMDFGVFRFTVENAVESGGILTAYFRQKTPATDYTRGLFTRGVE